MSKSDAEIDLAFASLGAITTPAISRPYESQENQLLELYEELSSLKLEQAVIRAENGTDQGDMSATLDQAQRDLLHARATFMVKQSIVENVLQSDPIVQAVGSPINGPARALEYSINHRDVLAMIHANLTSDRTKTLNKLTSEQAENLLTAYDNRGLAATLLEMVEKSSDSDLSNIRDTSIATDLDNVRADAKVHRKRYRIIKGLMSGVVVASGVDWAKDDHLRDYVLDTED